MSTKVSVLACAAACPAVLLILLEAGAFGLGVVTGDNPRLPMEILNPAEATAVRDGSEVVRLAREGHDLSRKYPVRTGLLEDRPVTATPLEAAVSLKRPELVVLLFEEGVQVDAATWMRLACVAQATDGDVLTVLSAHQPPGTELRCTGDERLFE